MKRSRKLQPERNVGGETQPAETRRELPEATAVRGAEVVGGELGEGVRIRARRAWMNWDEAEVTDELAPWPAAPTR